MTNVCYSIAGDQSFTSGRILKRTGAKGLSVPALCVPNREEVQSIIQKTHLGYLEWSNTPIETRLVLLENLKNLLQKKTNQICQLDCRETGRALWDLKTCSLPKSIETFEWFIENSPKDEYYEELSHRKTFILRQPLGVILCILWSQWLCWSGKLSALINGNSILLSQRVFPASALAFQRLSRSRFTCKCYKRSYRRRQSNS